MKQQYLIWNKDSVSEETIFNDIYKLSDGRITVPDDVHIGMGMTDGRGNGGNNQQRNNFNRNNKGKNNNNNKRRKK